MLHRDSTAQPHDLMSPPSVLLFNLTQYECLNDICTPI